jgi:hypothetical protein
MKRNAEENAGVHGDGKDLNVAGMEKFFDLFPFLLHMCLRIAC